MKITIIHQGFHGKTEISLRVQGNPGDQVRLSDHQMDRLRTGPCGISDCRCGESALGAVLHDNIMQIPTNGVIDLCGYYGKA